MPITFTVSRVVPRDVDAVGVPVAGDGPVPRSLGVGRSALAALGFEGKPGQAVVVPSASGPAMVAVGVGDPAAVTAKVLRDAAAGFARAVSRYQKVATTLPTVGSLDPATAAQAVVEGMALATYRYAGLKTDPPPVPLADATLVVGRADVAAAEAGASRGSVLAEATALARDLANTPPGHLTARDLAERAVQLGAQLGLRVDVIDEHAAAEMGLGGLLGVNRGSAEPPRLVRITYRPRRPRGTVALVGKGIMFDSGGLSLKNTDGMQAMKMDMSGAAAVLAAMTAIARLQPKVAVVGYLCCTDNLPSGTAMKVGDVLRIRNGKTVEVLNTDAEGRLVLADGLSLAVEEGADAVVDIATLTGACMVALGTGMAGLMGNHQGWVDQVRAAADRTDEPVWQLPLPDTYRKLLDSEVADLKNVGGPYAGAITAGLFLKEFVGDVPWAHLDMAGPMRVDGDDRWLVKGASGYGVRLLVDLVEHFAPLR